MKHISNEDVKSACAPFEPSRVAEWTRVVVKLSDTPPFIEAYGRLPNYIGFRNIWGVATEEAERLVAERKAQFDRSWS